MRYDYLVTVHMQSEWNKRENYAKFEYVRYNILKILEIIVVLKKRCWSIIDKLIIISPGIKIRI